RGPDPHGRAFSGSSCLAKRARPEETTVARGVVDSSEQPIFSAYEMTDRAKEAILASGIFFQRADSPEIRGYYEPDNNLIRLTDSANLSTFLHEFAHFMLEAEASGSE